MSDERLCDVCRHNCCTEVSALRAERSALIAELDRKAAEARAFWGERDEARASLADAERGLTEASAAADEARELLATARAEVARLREAGDRRFNEGVEAAATKARGVVERWLDLREGATLSAEIRSLLRPAPVPAPEAAEDAALLDPAVAWRACDPLTSRSSPHAFGSVAYQVRRILPDHPILGSADLDAPAEGWEAWRLATLAAIDARRGTGRASHEGGHE